MKIERFLTWIQDKLLNYPDINFITVKMFMDKFNQCLSKKEQKRWKIPLDIISEFSLKQISLDSFVSKQIANNLENELNNIKNGVNNEIQTKKG